MVGEDERGGGAYETAADCIDAGMYWFGQSDLAAAEAWWRRALEIEPDNQRAKNCLRLVQSSSSTGFKSDSWARLPASRPDQPPRESTDVFEDPDLSTDVPEAGIRRGPRTSDLGLASGSWAPPAPSSGPQTARRAVEAPLTSSDLPRWSRAAPGDLDSSSEQLELASDPFCAESSPESGSLDLPAGYLEDAPASGATGLGRFLDAVEESRSSEGPTHDLSRSSPQAPPDYEIRSPWDEGPSRTSVITVRSSGEFDAVADPTPLPEIDRERFFNRGDPSSRDEIVDFLRATGDLPSSRSIDLVSIDEPTEGPPGRTGLSDDLAGMAIQDAVSTEPATRVSSATSPHAKLESARERYQLHDFQGVIDALSDYPPDAEGQTEVRNMLAESRAHLLRMYEAKIGSLDQVPRVMVSSEEVIWLNLNHRAGFILSQVDGTVSYEDLISLSGMPRLDTVRILTELLDQRVIGV